jgi:signal recognition particle subunit SRP54
MPDMEEALEGDQLKHIEAMILSMTLEERRNPDIINGSRRKRIARGSGTTPQDINQLLAQFNEMSTGKGKWAQLARQMGGGGGLPGMPDMEGMPALSGVKAPSLPRPSGGNNKKSAKALRKEKKKHKARSRR